VLILGLRTIHLKLHKPSALKKKIINTAFINYNNAFNYLLSIAHESIVDIEENYNGKNSRISLSKWIDKKISADLNQFNVQPFKDSLKIDIGMVLASYLIQKKSNPDIAFPKISKKDEYMPDKLRPIYFCRYDTKRSFCILYDKQNDRFFAKLFLMNSKNAKVRTSQEVSRKLIYISKNQEEVKLLKKETYIVIPLSFGKWQENMLKQAIDKPEILRTAHLIMKGNDYFLSLSIDLPEEDKIESATFIGISRGIKKAVNYTITDLKGDILEKGAFESNPVLQNTDMKTDICMIANKIVDIAVKNKSIVVLENLVGKGDRLSWTENGTTCKPVFGCKQYNYLVRVLEYKLPQRGLNAPVKVSSVDIFHRCCICGSNSKKNRFSKTMFICTTCGFSCNLDNLGSVNLATKLIKYENSPLKLKAKRISNGIYLHSELIGLELFVPQNENPIDRIKEEVTKISERVEQGIDINNYNSKDIKIIISKLIKQDFKNIEII
jgi:putative transposase